MNKNPASEKHSVLTVEELRGQLAEAQETLKAIHQGEVDALVVSTPEGDKIYTISGAERPYRILIQEMKEGAVILSDDNTILYCNDGFAKMVKSPLDKTIGTNIQKLISKTHIASFEELLAQGRTGKGATTKEITLQATDSALVPTQISINSLRMDNLLSPFLIVADLTQHMEEEVKRYTANLERAVQERTEALKNAERFAAIGETAGMVGHDIRNPLQSIIGELYLEKDWVNSLPDNQTKGDLKESLDSIERNVTYINKIVADLQDYARTLTPLKQKVNLEETIEDAFTMVSTPENVQVSISAEKNLPQLTADSTMLKRVLVNLIQNAVQAMPNGGNLTVSSTRKDSQVLINVEDTGEGIPEEAKGKLFTPLFTTKSKGQGFGLAVVKRLVEAQGGTITFESELGKGTAFTIKMPLT